jgi:L-malate glycosyltransferase
MNIGIFCHHTLGGSSKTAIMLAKGLANMGYHVSIFSLFRPVLYEDGNSPNLSLYCLAHANASYYNSPASDLVLNWPKELYLSFKSLVIQTIKGKHLSILHAHYAIPFARLLHDIKKTLPHLLLTTVVTLHGTDVSNEHIRKRYGASLIRDLDQMDYLTTVSEYHLSLCKRYYSLKAPISVVSDFIDKLPPFTARSESECPKIIHVSNFRPVKQSKLAIEVLKLVLQQKRVKLLMLGDGPELSGIKDHAKQLGLEEWVEFVGFQIHTAPYYKKSALFLSTSQTESFGLAGLEAMAWSLPLVVPYVGGFINLIEQNKQGRFYEPNNLEDAAKAILDILNDKDMQREMSVKAFRRAQRFEAGRIIGQYLPLYQARAKV